MTKRTTTFEFMLPVRDPATPVYRWLYNALRAEILGGRLRPGARVPGTRDLAEQYSVSRGTIVNAFELLKSEGYVEGNVGSGTYVSKVLPDRPFSHNAATGATPPKPGKQRRKISVYGKRLTAFPDVEDRPIRAFRANIPALDLFPKKLWTKTTSHRLRRLPTELMVDCEPLGYRPLREAIADYLGRSRGVKCNAEQIAIVSGIQEALDLTARIFLNPGDRVCMEDPGYVGALVAFKGCGAKVVGVGLDAEGMKLPGLGLKESKLIYVTPAHQFPMGITMTLRRRLDLLEWARRAGALVLEDDYDGEYRYSGRPVPALQGLDRAGLVLFAGSFSKVLFPSLRLGYLVIPPDLVSYFAAAKSVTSRHAPLLEQAVLCDFIVEGHFGRHLRHMREIYAERLFTLMEEARRKLAGMLEISNVEAGLQTVGWLREGVDGEAVARAAAGRKVEVVPLSRYGTHHRKRDGLQLGFAALDVAEIRRGINELAVVLEHEAKASPERRRRPG